PRPVRRTQARRPLRAFTPWGRRVWQRRVTGGIYAATNSVGRRLYVHTKAGLLYALNARTGRRAWVRRTGWGIGYPECAATRTRVWCANGWGDNRLSSWSRRGRKLWSRRLPGQVMGAVVLTRRMLWVGTHDGRDSSYNRKARRVLGFNPWTGRLRVRMGSARYDPLAAGRSMLYVIHYAKIEAIRER
ncbi:MAG: PQQ-binding-like beta-propeller repeat protein, partial [Thermoleophilaceae bacterium]